MTTTLITGASSGIGAEMARQLAAKGEDLALCARRIERLEEVREEILTNHPERTVVIAALDVTDDEAVFRVFDELREEFETIDRIVVNAGIGKGAPIGTGGHAANKATVMTNFVAALAQAEAAMEIFRDQRYGHLVMISSMSAYRGMPGTMTTYAATKSGVAALAEGIQHDLAGRADLDIDVSVIYPGFIQSEMLDVMEGKPPFTVDTYTGVAAIVSAIESRSGHARVPAWPWLPMGTAMRHLPLSVLRRLT